MTFDPTSTTPTNLTSSIGPHNRSRYLPARGKEMALIRNSVTVVSQKEEVMSVQGYTQLVPGTSTNAGNRVALSLCDQLRMCSRASAGESVIRSTKSNSESETRAMLRDRVAIGKDCSTEAASKTAISAKSGRPTGQSSGGGRADAGNDVELA